MSKDSGTKVTFELENQEPEFEIDSELGIVKVNPRYSSLLRSEGTKRILKVFAIDNDGKKSSRPGHVQVFPNNRLTGKQTKHSLGLNVIYFFDFLGFNEYKKIETNIYFKIHFPFNFFI